MSILIEIDSQECFQHPINIKDSLKAIFKSTFTQCHKIIDEQQLIKFYIRPSPDSFRLTTLWYFKFEGPNLRLQIKFYNLVQNDFLRAWNERMRLEATLLMRKINQRLSEGLCFQIDNQSGVLKIFFTMVWSSFYQYFQNREKLLYFIKHCIKTMNLCDEFIMFLEPLYKREDQTPQQSDVRAKILRFRTILKNTKEVAKIIQKSVGSAFLLKMKEKDNAKFNQEQLEVIRQMYMRNITAYQQSQVGLEDQDCFELRKEKFIHEFEQIRMNEEGITKKRREKPQFRNKNPEPKIMIGLETIEAIDYEDEEQNIQMSQGAHCHISSRMYKVSLVFTISQGTTEYIENYMPQYMYKIEKKMVLVEKRCPPDACQASINSFKNELQVLQFLRNKYHLSIGEYFLKLKQKSYFWDEKDPIYMKRYKEDLFHLVKKHALSFRKRLEIAYNISKGLCFLCKSRICHRDLKPQNIVMDANMIPKIIDFGSCVAQYQEGAFQAFDGRLLTTPGFHIYYHKLPAGYTDLRQKFKKDQYQQHPLFDIYSFGKILSFLFFNVYDSPLPEVSLLDPYSQFLDHITFLINMCLEIDPDNRPNSAEITSYLGSLKQLLKIQFHQ